MTSIILSLILLISGTQGRGQPTGAPRPAEPVGTERIAGTVFQGETQRPFPRVRVELRREDYGKQLSGGEKPCNPSRDIDDPKLRRYAMTDANGHFTFQNIVPGRYYLLAEHEGYLRAEYGRQDGLFPRGMILEIGPQDGTLVSGTVPVGARRPVHWRAGNIAANTSGYACERAAGSCPAAASGPDDHRTRL